MNPFLPGASSAVEERMCLPTKATVNSKHLSTQESWTPLKRWKPGEVKREASSQTPPHHGVTCEVRAHRWACLVKMAFLLLPHQHSDHTCHGHVLLP